MVSPDTLRQLAKALDGSISSSVTARQIRQCAEAWESERNDIRMLCAAAHALATDRDEALDHLISCARSASVKVG